MNRYIYPGLLAAALLLMLAGAGQAAPAPPAQSTLTARPVTNTHAWWAIDRERAAAYYNEGRKARREGRPVDSLRLGLYPATAQTVTTLDNPGTFVGVSLAVPAMQLRRDGFEAENRMATEAECNKEIAEAASRRPTVDFVGIIRPMDGDEGPAELSLTPIVVVETSTGQKIRLDEPSTPTDMLESLAQGQAAFAMAHRESDDTHLLLVSIPLYDKEGKAFLTPQTTWVRLWIFGKSKRIPITYDLQGRLPGVGEDTGTRVTIGKAE